MLNLEKAESVLASDEYTCALCKDEQIYTSKERGVKPLVVWLQSSTDFNGFSAADKVVGKGAAFLYVLLGINAVYAHIISIPALELLKRHNINVKFDIITDNIINRKGNGICPFEEAVLNIDNAEAAYVAILNKMKEINIII